MPFAQQTVQACHAILESQRLFPDLPEHEHPHLVLCRAKNEQALVRLMAQWRTNHVVFACFHEPDQDNQLTALATGTVLDRTPFRKLQLLHYPQQIQEINP